MATVSAPALLHILDLAGVAVGAISGALAAGRRRLDLIGVAVVATVTAIGGGTIRDVLIDRHPVFWIANPSYLVVILSAAGLTIVYTRFKSPPDRALLIADAFALGLFAIGGAQVAAEANLAGLLVVVMGTITATAGGIVRDVLCNQVPLVMQSGLLYATAAIMGSTVYWLLHDLALPEGTAAGIGVAVIITVRLLSMAFGLRMPVYTIDPPAPD